MYYARVVDPSSIIENDENVTVITLMEDYTIDNLIQAFIKESLRRAGSEDRVTDLKIEIMIERNKNERIGTMLWALSEKLNKPVLIVVREDRGKNVYVYDTHGQLIPHYKVK